MKKLLLLSFIITTFYCGFSQDTIIKKNNDTIVANVKIVNANHINYTLPNKTLIYILNTNKIKLIKFKDGDIQEFKTKYLFKNEYEKTYRFIGEIGASPSNSYNNKYRFSVINGYQINKYFFTGLNLGIEVIGNSYTFVSGKANLRFNFTRNLISPYLSLSYGTSHLLFYEDHKQIPNYVLSYEAAIGVQLQFNKNAMINFSIGLESMKLNNQYGGMLTCFSLGFSIW